MHCVVLKHGVSNCSPSPLVVIVLLYSRGVLIWKLENYPATRTVLHRSRLPYEQIPFP